MRPVLLVLLAAVLFGTTGTAQALGAPGVDPLSLGAARIAVGGAVLAAAALLIARRGRTRSHAPPASPGSLPPPGTPRPPFRTAIAPVLLGAAGVVAYQPAFFLGTERGGVAVGTVVALGSAPLATGVITWILARRFPGARWAAATGVSLVGLALLAGVGAAAVRGAGGGAAAVDPVGIAGSLAAGLAYAVYTLASKRLLDAGWSPSAAMGAVFGTAAVVSAAILPATDTAWLATGPGASTALWLGLATVAVAYLLFAAGLRALPAATVSTLTLAEPVTAALLGLVVLGEILPASSWWGLAAIGVGILVLVVPARRARRPPD